MIVDIIWTSGNHYLFGQCGLRISKTIHFSLSVIHCGENLPFSLKLRADKLQRL